MQGEPRLPWLMAAAEGVPQTQAPDATEHEARAGYLLCSATRVKPGTCRVVHCFFGMMAASGRVRHVMAGGQGETS